MSYQDRRAFLMELVCPGSLQGPGISVLATCTPDFERERCVLGRFGVLVVALQDSVH